MYPPPQNYPSPSPFGQQPYGMAPPVPASATVLFVCGVFKLIGAAFSMLGGALMLGGAAAVADQTARSTNAGDQMAGGFGTLLAGGAAVVLLCVGAAFFSTGLLDTIGGHLARKGKNSGRIMGIVSAVFGLLGSLGSLGNVTMMPSSNESAAFNGGAIVGALSTGGVMFALNLYLLISFVRNADSFRQ